MTSKKSNSGSNFQPLIPHGDLLTLAANFWPRNLDEARFPATDVFFPTEPGIQVLAKLHQPHKTPRASLVVLHGLEGSHTSGYMLSMAQAALESNLRVYRLNMRTCGGTEHLAPTLYHAGLTQDLAAILDQLSPGPVFLMGYSLGGNVVLKLTGEGHPRITATVSVSTPLDLMACCLRMQEPRNFLYSNKFIKSLKARYTRRHHAFPDKFPLDGLDQVRSVLEFDDKFTSKAFGFGNAETYYRTQSSNQFLSRIQVPTLLIHAQDDPLIPFRVYEDANPAANPNITSLFPKHGGHVGFLSRSNTPQSPRFWAEHQAIQWLQGIQ
jgi:uncharacterized protein